MTNPINIKKAFVGIAAALAVASTALSGTYAWNDYKQHKSNRMGSSDTKYEARLVEEFDDEDDWTVEKGRIPKKISVVNLGERNDNFGDVYVRIQLKEYMEIGGFSTTETTLRYMIDTEGQFITYASEQAAQAAWPGHNVANLTDKVTGKSGWFIETQAGDPNGQMGKHVVIDIAIEDAVPVIPGTTRAVNLNHHGYQGPNGFVTRSDECNYTVHPWNGMTLPTASYVDWHLNDPAIIKLSDWLADGSPAVDKWIIDDVSNSGWVYWGRALRTDGDMTSTFMDSVSLKVQPDGCFYYVIHVELDAISYGELGSWGDIGDGFINQPGGNGGGNRVPANGVTINGGNKTIEVGERYTPGCIVTPSDSTDRPLWSSSNPNIATVNPNNGEIVGVTPGVVTITVTVNGHTDSITVTVVEGDGGGNGGNVPATGITINGGDKTIDVDERYTPGYTIAPSNSTDTPQWSSSNPGIATVNPNTGEIIGIAPGQTVITATANGKTDTITITVRNPSQGGNDLPLQKGEDGPYAPQVGGTPDSNFALWLFGYKDDFDNVDYDQYGSIKLSDILVAGTDLTGFTVEAVNPQMAGAFSIGKDKANDTAIIYSYYPPLADWVVQAQAGPQSPHK